MRVITPSAGSVSRRTAGCHSGFFLGRPITPGQWLRASRVVLQGVPHRGQGFGLTQAAVAAAVFLSPTSVGGGLVGARPRRARLLSGNASGKEWKGAMLASAKDNNFSPPVTRPSNSRGRECLNHSLEENSLDAISLAAS